MKSVSRQEWRWVFGVAVMLLALTCVPYLTGYAMAPDEQVFNGFTTARPDGFSYIAKMRLGVQGNWGFHIFYTDEPHDPIYLTFLPYIIPGQVLGLFTSESSPTLYTTMILTYHGLRLVLGFGLIFVVYRFVAAFLDNRYARLLALIIIMQGGGWGLILVPLGGTPPEWSIPEGFTHYILYAVPHLILARTATLTGWLLLFASARNRGFAVLAGLAWCVTGLNVPFHMAVIYVVLAVWGVLLWVRARAFPTDAFIRALIAGGMTLPLFGYYAWVFTTNETFVIWSSQNILISPPPQDYLLAYGVLIFFGLFAVVDAWRRAEEPRLLLLAWALAGLLLVYLPLNVQRRLGEGVIVPLTVLAVLGVERLINSNAKGQLQRTWLRPALLFLTLPTVATFYLLTMGAAITQQPGLFEAEAEIDAMLWLDANAVERERGAVVLTRIEDGNFLPAYTNLRTYVGHGPETINYLEKEVIANAYFDDEVPANTRQALYENHTIEYVFFGVGDDPPAWADEELRQIYDQDDVTIFAVE